MKHELDDEELDDQEIQEENQKDLGNTDEKVLLMIKPHPWFFSRILLIIVISVIVILISFYFLGASAVTSYLILASAIITIYVFSRNYYCWSKTHYLLTEERIICYEQEGWVSQTMKEATLNDILFISHEKKGVTNHLVNRGTIYIRTSGGVEEEIVLRNIANPYEVEKKIAEIKRKYTGSSFKEEPKKPVKHERPLIR